MEPAEESGKVAKVLVKLSVSLKSGHVKISYYECYNKRNTKMERVLI